MCWGRLRASPRPPNPHHEPKIPHKCDVPMGWERGAAGQLHWARLAGLRCGLKGESRGQGVGGARLGGG